MEYNSHCNITTLLTSIPVSSTSLPVARRQKQISLQTKWWDIDTSLPDITQTETPRPFLFNRGCRKMKLSPVSFTGGVLTISLSRVGHNVKMCLLATSPDVERIHVCKNSDKSTGQRPGFSSGTIQIYYCRIVTWIGPTFYKGPWTWNSCSKPFFSESKELLSNLTNTCK